VHIEIPADDTSKSQQFWGSLFGWQFQANPGPFEYHTTQIGGEQGAAITNMEPGKRGTRPYFAVDEIKAGAGERARRGGKRADAGSGHGLVRGLQGPARQRVRPLADRHFSPTTSAVDQRRGKARARLPHAP
jgi:hypothetical protein